MKVTALDSEPLPPCRACSHQVDADDAPRGCSCTCHEWAPPPSYGTAFLRRVLPVVRHDLPDLPPLGVCDRAWRDLPKDQRPGHPLERIYDPLSALRPPLPPNRSN